MLTLRYIILTKILLFAALSLDAAELEKIKSFNLPGTTISGHNYIEYKNGNIAIAVNYSTDTQLKFFSFVSLIDTSGKEYFQKIVKPEEDTLRLEPMDLRFTGDNEIEVLFRKTLKFYDLKFNIFYHDSRLNIKRFDFNGSISYDFIDDNDSTYTTLSDFNLRYDSDLNPMNLFTPNGVKGGVNIAINQYDKNGFLMNTKTIDEFDESKDNGIYIVSRYISSNDGNYYGFGRRTGFGAGNQIDTLSTIIFKIDSNLNLIWERIIDPTEGNIGKQFTSLLEIENDNLMLIGNNSFVEITKEGKILKFNPINDLNEEASITDKVIRTESGKYLVAGRVNSRKNAYLAILDSSKTKLWDKEIINNYTNSFVDILEYKPNHFILLESERETKKLNIYLLKDIITNVEKENVVDDITIYPNPGTETVFVDLKTRVQNIRIYDNTGSLVKEINAINRSNFKLDISDLSNGVYHLEFSTIIGAFSKKLIVE